MVIQLWFSYLNIGYICLVLEMKKQKLFIYSCVFLPESKVSGVSSECLEWFTVRNSSKGNRKWNPVTMHLCMTFLQHACFQGVLDLLCGNDCSILVWLLSYNISRIFAAFVKNDYLRNIMYRTSWNSHWNA